MTDVIENKMEKLSVNVPLVCVIIPTYNRFDSLIEAIQSIQNQTYSNIEIIVSNDKSSDKRYYEYDFSVFPNLQIIHLPKNSREIFKFPCPGYTRNEGMKHISPNAEYIAFLDDDDYWMPNKLEKQMNALKNNPEYKMSSTNAIMGRGHYSLQKKVRRFHPQNCARRRRQKLWHSGGPPGRPAPGSGGPRPGNSAQSGRR